MLVGNNKVLSADDLLNMPTELHVDYLMQKDRHILHLHNVGEHLMDWLSIVDDFFPGNFYPGKNDKKLFRWSGN